MFVKQEDLFYYLTVMNETYKMPAMPEGSEKGILKGIYRFSKSSHSSKSKAHLFGSGTIINEVIKAQKILEEKYDVSADVWSVTSYKELYHDAIETERWNLLNPDKKQKIPYISEALVGESGVFVASSDYLKSLPCSIAKWIPGPMAALGTDGYGRSASRVALRNFFEIDHRFVTIAALIQLAEQGTIEKSVVQKAYKDLDINPQKLNPHHD